MSAKPVEPAYRGRFAPSPTGPLHAGSLAAALASWLDARAHGGRWLVRIEDLDTPRRVAGADTAILSQLSACGLIPDEPPVWQSTRAALYEAALAQLTAAGLTYPCGCSRADIEAVLAQRGHFRGRHAELIYPGTCRNGLKGRPGLAIRLRICGDACEITWHDRRLGEQHQDVKRAVGDFVLRRADGPWSYQLAVVIDDAAQGITDVVRGEDLADSTARQIYLQRRLGLATPSHLHTPLVLGNDGHKLSKGNGAQPIDRAAPLQALRAAGRTIGVESNAGDVSAWLSQATAHWAPQWPRRSTSDGT